MDALAGKSRSPRREFFYFVFVEQRAHGLDVWQDPMVPLRFPKLFNLRSDPFETADREGMSAASASIG